MTTTPKLLQLKKHPTSALSVKPVRVLSQRASLTLYITIHSLNIFDFNIFLEDQLSVHVEVLADVIRKQLCVCVCVQVGSQRVELTLSELQEMASRQQQQIEAQQQMLVAKVTPQPSHLCGTRRSFVK